MIENRKTPAEIINSHKVERFNWLAKKDFNFGDEYPITRFFTRKGKYGKEVVFCLDGENAVSTRIARADGELNRLGIIITDLLENGYDGSSGGYSIRPIAVEFEGKKGISFEIIPPEE